MAARDRLSEMFDREGRRFPGRPRGRIGSLRRFRNVACAAEIAELRWPVAISLCERIVAYQAPAHYRGAPVSQYPGPLLPRRKTAPAAVFPHGTQHEHVFTRELTRR